MPISAQLQQMKERAENQTVITGTLVNTEPSDIDQPSFRSELWKSQVEDVIYVRDVFDGTRALQAKGKIYLPQYRTETDTDYAVRLQRARLFNAVARTARGLNGLIFRKDLVLGKDVPPRIRQHAENVDLAGRHLDVFAKDVSEASILDGHTFIHVDAPKANEGPRATLAGNTLTDSQMRQPYWTHVLKQDAINIQWTLVNGMPVLTLFVFLEQGMKQVGRFGQQSVDRIRALRPGSFSVYELVETDGKKEWQLIEEGGTSLDFIPIATVYANRTGLFESRPPLLDLAYENVGHYVNSNEHEFSLARARIPMPFFKGVREADVTWGANYAIYTDNPDADASMLESQGFALEVSAKDIEKREARMAVLGLSMLHAEKRAAETAKAKEIDAAETDSALAVAARGLNDGLEEALGIHAKYLAEAQGGSITINRDFRSFELTAQEIRELREAVASNQLSIETLFYNLGRAGYLPDDFDAEVEKGRLAETLGLNVEETA